MQRIRVVAVGAALLVSTIAEAQGSGGVAPTKHVHASRPSAAAATTTAAPAAASDSSVKVNEFLSYDPAAKTVSLKLFAAHGSLNGVMKFN